MGIFDWNILANLNGTADAAINFQEGQLPNSVNNSARQLMARVAERLRDESPIRTTGGAANAYTCATASPLSSYQTGLKVAFMVHAANGAGGCTLALAALGGGFLPAKPLRRASGIDLPSASLNTLRPYMANYIAATDEFLLEGCDTDGLALNSPAFTGVPTAPTAAAGNNSTQIATTAFATNAINALATSTTNALALKANINSPALTGVPSAPTAGRTVNNGQLATTAFVHDVLTVSGNAPCHTVRAWVNFNGAGTITQDSNVTSVTDLGFGVWRVNFTTAAPSAGYAVNLTAWMTFPTVCCVTAKAAGSCSIGAWNTSSGQPDEPTQVSAIFVW